MPSRGHEWGEDRRRCWSTHKATTGDSAATRVSARGEVAEPPPPLTRTSPAFCCVPYIVFSLICFASSSSEMAARAAAAFALISAVPARAVSSTHANNASTHSARTTNEQDSIWRKEGRGVGEARREGRSVDLHAADTHATSARRRSAQHRRCRCSPCQSRAQCARHRRHAHTHTPSAGGHDAPAFENDTQPISARSLDALCGPFTTTPCIGVITAAAACGCAKNHTSVIRSKTGMQQGARSRGAMDPVVCVAVSFALRCSLFSLVCRSASLCPDAPHMGPQSEPSTAQPQQIAPHASARPVLVLTRRCVCCDPVQRGAWKAARRDICSIRCTSLAQPPSPPPQQPRPPPSPPPRPPPLVSLRWPAATCSRRRARTL